VSAAIQFQEVSKLYRLGEVGTGALAGDVQRVWAKLRGKPDPFAKLGSVNDRENEGGDYVWALKDVSFEVEQGEVLGIIGRNGAGKSTLLKLLSRITAPTTGTIKARGRIASLLEVGTGFHPELTGRENIFLNGAILGMRRSEVSKQLDKMIDFSGCAKYIDTPVKRYSSGMIVRLGFAVAAHLECEILVVDEVLAVGDIEFQRKCFGKMRDVASGGRTVLFVSHNMGAVSQLCRRGIVFERGRIAMEDSVSACVERYLAVDSDAFVRFEPKGSSGVSFHSVRIVNKLGATSKSFFYDEPIIVEIHYTNRACDPFTELGVRVLSQEGVIVFTTQRSNHIATQLSGETNLARVKIPGGFLTPGNYAISIGAHVPHKEIFDLRESSVGFRIEETGSEFSSYSSERYGVVFCECDWEDHAIPQEELDRRVSHGRH
jgi:lipopolysaccharide transport system ATP-binding protein